MGIAYERSVGFHKDFHAHDRPMILLPRGACVITVRTAGEGPGLLAVDSVTGRAMRYIEANLFSDVPLPAIACHAFASPSTLLRHFRDDTGKTPHAYIKARRMEEARRLLEEGGRAVGDVAM